MLLVLLALLGASVAFAQLLVNRTHAPATLAWNFPASFKILPPDPDEPEAIEIRALGSPAGHQRLLRGIVIDLPDRITPQQQLDALQHLFATLSDAQNAVASPAPIAGRPGLQLEGVAGGGDSDEFTILRMIATNDRAIAICYSGLGKLTDWDRLYFNNICQRVTLQGEAPPTTKVRPR
jgi:hypothetical protein